MADVRTTSSGSRSHTSRSEPISSVDDKTPWWKARSPLERVLICLVTIAILFIFVLSGVLGWLTLGTNMKTSNDVTYGERDSTERTTGSTNEETNLSKYRDGRKKFRPNREMKTEPVVEMADICITPTCVRQAAKLLDNMDTTFDPCDDFYSFSCGSFVSRTVIPDDRSSISLLSRIKDGVYLRLRSVLDAPVRDKDTRPTRLAKVMFKSCMNTSRIEARGLEPMRNILRYLGGWPVLSGSSWSENEFDWKELMYKLRDIGTNFYQLLVVTVSPNVKNITYSTIYVDQPPLGLNKEYLLKGLGEGLVETYREFQVEMAVMFGALPQLAKGELMKALEFEIELAKISIPNADRRDQSRSFRQMSIAEMDEKFPTIPWKRLFNHILQTKLKVRDDDTVILLPKYITALERLLSRTDKRTLANYMIWRVVQYSIVVMPEAVRNVALKYLKVYKGKLMEEARWRQCMRIMSEGTDLHTEESARLSGRIFQRSLNADFITPAVGALYVQEFFDKESKLAMRDIVLNIRKAFKDILFNVDWMDAKTRRRSLEKVEAMRFSIGYPDELLNDTILTAHYQHLDLDENNYMENLMMLKKFSDDYVYAGLWEKVKPLNWVDFGQAAVVNAYYHQDKNAIGIPAGILHGVIFDSKRPKYMNYGAIGFVVGHELTHGFDDIGRQFDKNGELKDWWANETKRTFLKKTACMVEQYSGYRDTATGLYLKGGNTQGENIADNGGVKEAYYAYVAWSRAQSFPEQRLPGLEALTPRQMFWVSTAQTWCWKVRTESMRVYITTNEHSPFQFRVIGALSNMEEFARDFNCTTGSRMNPKHKCRVW